MRPRPLLTIAVVAALVLVLGGLLIGRLLPADGSDGTVDPVVIDPAGLTVSGGPTPTTAPATPSPTTPPTTRPTTPAATTPTQVKPRPRPVDEDDDDHEEDDDRRVGEDDDDPDDD